MSDNQSTTSSVKPGQDKLSLSLSKQTSKPQQQPQSQQQSSTGSFFEAVPEGAQMGAEVNDESSWNDNLVDYDSSKSNSLDDGTAAADCVL